MKRKQDDIITRVFNGLRTTGFIAVKGHGLSEAEWQHQFDLGKLLNEVSEEEKHALHANIKEGSWAGYKVRLNQIIQSHAR
jgi:isopenicillin N synthase-like dioxygenase